MKLSLFLSFLILASTGSAQGLKPGQYDALRIAYDNQSELITGYYEDYTGWDANTESPRFSCIFYLEGKVINGKARINTYQPGYKLFYANAGTIEIKNDTLFTLTFDDPDKASCSNVTSFEKPRDFRRNNRNSASQIRFIATNKAYFHSKPSADSQLKSYVIKGDILSVEKIEGVWAYCSYTGKSTTKGWIRVNELNTLEDKAVKLPTPDDHFLEKSLLNSDSIIKKYIEANFTDKGEQKIMGKTSWDTDGKSRDCHLEVEYDGVTMGYDDCEMSPTHTYTFRGYSKEEVVRIMKMLFPNSENGKWEERKIGSVWIDGGCDLLIRQKPFGIVVSYYCGC